MSEKIKNIAYIFSSKAIIFAIGIIRGFFVPGYLGPSMYGIIQLLRLVKTVLGFSNLGFGQAYIRLVPNIKNDWNYEKEKRELQNTVFSFLVISSTLGMLVTLLIPFFFRQDSLDMQRLMLFCFSITALTHFFTLTGSFFYTTHYINKNFPLISKLSVFQAALSFGLVMSTIFFWKIYGVFLAELAAVIVIQAIYLYRVKIHVRFKLKWENFKSVFKFAFPFFLSNVGFHFARLTDRTIITIFLSLKDLGIYGFALNLSNQLRIITISMNTVLTPYILDELSGEKEEIFKRSRKIKSYTHSICILSALIILPLFFLRIIFD